MITLFYTKLSDCFELLFLDTSNYFTLRYFSCSLQNLEGGSQLLVAILFKKMPKGFTPQILD